MTKLSGLITKVKNSFDVTYEELKAKPQLMDADEAGLRFIDKEIVEAAEFSPENARKAGEKFLKGKFFPRDKRPALWPLLIENKHHINNKLYKCYSDMVDKRLKENDSYGIYSLTIGNIPIIRSNIKDTLSRWAVPEDPAMILSVVKVLLVFESYQPNIGYVPGLEKIALFLMKNCDEPTAFTMLYNILFSSKLLWAYFEGKKTITELNFQLLDRVITNNPQLKKSYEINRDHLERFLIEAGCLLYLKVLDFSTVE